jgi:hypothetical protein
MRSIIFVIGLLLVLLVSGCSVKNASIVRQRPALLSLKNFKTIYVSEVTNEETIPFRPDHNNIIIRELEQRLMNVGFKVLDRDAKNINEIRRENMFRQARKKQFDSKILDADIFISGKITMDRYDEKNSKEDPWIKDGKKHQKNIREGFYELSVYFKIGSQTSEKLGGFSFNAKTETKRKTADNQVPEIIDQKELFEICVNDILEQLIRTISPHSKIVSVPFVRDDELHEAHIGIANFQNGNTQYALEIFGGDLKRVEKSTPKIKAMAFYNLGITQVYSNFFDEGISNIREATKLMPEEKFYWEALAVAELEKNATMELRRQQQQ